MPERQEDGVPIWQPSELCTQDLGASARRDPGLLDRDFHQHHVPSVPCSILQKAPTEEGGPGGQQATAISLSEDRTQSPEERRLPLLPATVATAQDRSACQPLPSARGACHTGDPQLPLCSLTALTPTACLGSSAQGAVMALCAAPHHVAPRFVAQPWSSEGGPRGPVPHRETQGAAPTRNANWEAKKGKRASTEQGKMRSLPKRGRTQMLTFSKQNPREDEMTTITSHPHTPNPKKILPSNQREYTLPRKEPQAGYGQLLRTAAEATRQKCPNSEGRSSPTGLCNPGARGGRPLLHRAPPSPTRRLKAAAQGSWLQWSWGAAAKPSVGRGLKSGCGRGAESRVPSAWEAKGCWLPFNISKSHFLSKSVTDKWARKQISWRG